MDIEMRRTLTPQAFISQLFAETKDGKISIEYHPFLDEAYTLDYDVSWTAEDAQQLVQRYNALTAALRRIAEQSGDLDVPENREKLHSPEDRQVWDTYIRPFEPFEVEDEVIDTLYFRRETETLDDEENELIERHYAWFQKCSLQRLPFEKCPPAFVINRARRYARLHQMRAPAVIIDEEGRCLAEEMVLYYYGPDRLQEYKEI